MRAILINLNDEYRQINNVLNFEVPQAKELMFQLIENMLYWDSSWSSARRSADVMIDDWECTYEECNTLANVIYRMHCKIDDATRIISDKSWAVFNLDEILSSEEFLSVSITHAGDYRIEQWHRDHSSELTVNGSLLTSARGSRSSESRPVSSRENRRRRIVTPPPESFAVNRDTSSSYVKLRELERKENKRRAVYELKQD